MLNCNEATIAEFCSSPRKACSYTNLDHVRPAQKSMGSFLKRCRQTIVSDSESSYVSVRFLLHYRHWQCKTHCTCSHKRQRYQAIAEISSHTIGQTEIAHSLLAHRRQNESSKTMIYLQRHFSNPSIKSAEVRAHKTTEIAQKNKGGYLEKEIQLRAVTFIFYTPLLQFFNNCHNVWPECFQCTEITLHIPVHKKYACNGYINANSPAKMRLQNEPHYIAPSHDNRKLVWSNPKN